MRSKKLENELVARGYTFYKPLRRIHAFKGNHGISWEVDGIETKNITACKNRKLEKKLEGGKQVHDHLDWIEDNMNDKKDANDN